MLDGKLQSSGDEGGTYCDLAMSAETKSSPLQLGSIMHIHVPLVNM
jgi:hypothetical protein